MSNVARDKKDLKKRLCLGLGCTNIISTCRNWRICKDCKHVEEHRRNKSGQHYGAANWGLYLKSNKTNTRGSRE